MGLPEGDIRPPLKAPVTAPALGPTSDPAEIALAVRADRELVDDVVSGVEEAFAELFRRHQGSVSTSARMILGPGPQSDDVTAEVFLGLWLNPGKFDASRGSLLTYLRVQAKGRSIDLIRAEAARSRREWRDLQRSRLPDDEVGSRSAGADAGARLRHNMLLLAPPEREVIDLAFFGGFTYAEVANRLMLAEGTVKSRIRRGLEHLRASLSAEGSVDVESGRVAAPVKLDHGNPLSGTEAS